MDSPLLPQMRRAPDMTSSPTGMMSDLSISDPMSDADSFFASDPTPRRAQRSPTRHSQAASSSRDSLADLADEDFEDEHEDTPERPRAKPRFSLFAPNAAASSSTAHVPPAASSWRPEIMHEEGEEAELEPDSEDRPPKAAADASESQSKRDERLRESLRELRQINEIFDGFLGALESAKGHNERLEERVKQTSELLDMYTALLGQQEHTRRLIMNRQWTGVQDDYRIAAEEDQRKEEEAAAAEAERLRQEEEERALEEAKARAEEQAARVRELASLGRGGARGRGTRGVRGSGIPPPSSRGRGTGIRKASAGLGGQYADVKSSGYGPRRAT